MTGLGEIEKIRKSLTLAQRSALSLICSWGGVDIHGEPADRRDVYPSVRGIDARSLVGLAARGLIAGGGDRVLRPTILGMQVRE